MVDTPELIAALRAPEGVAITCDPGWHIGTFGLEYEDMGSVDTPAGPLPRFATLTAWFKEIRDEPEVRLLLQVVDGTPTVHISGVLSEGFGEPDQALDALTKIQPLTWWKNRAIVLLAMRVSASDLASVELMRSRLEVAVSTQTDRRRTRVTEAHLRAVADVYRDAVAAGQYPTAAVVEHFHTTRPTASRWVREARERRLLDPVNTPAAKENDQ
jgi:hypothetical protein